MVNPRPSIPSVWLKIRILDEREEGSKDKRKKRSDKAKGSTVEELKCCPTKSGFSLVGDGNLLKNLNPEQNS